jgi:hypothetical protein
VRACQPSLGFMLAPLRAKISAIFLPKANG